MNVKVLEEVDQFKYLKSAQTKDGTSIKEVNIILVQAHSAMTGLAILWKTTISSSTQIKLFKSLVLSILLCRCESWMLTVDLERRIQAFENKCYRRTYNERLCVGIGQVSSPDVWSFYCRALQVVMVQPCLPS